MHVQCAPACQTCEHLDFDMRCPKDYIGTDIWKAGDLNRMFLDIISNPHYQQYEPRVVSRPSLAPGDSEDTADYLVGGPWMIVFENIMTAEEAQRLIELGTEQGYERSGEYSGQKKVDGSYDSSLTDRRTSKNTWCREGCMEDPLARAVTERIVNVTGIPDANAEYLQMLQYEESGYYKRHHDYAIDHRDRAAGARMLTFFFYLNDVAQGGGTHFPDLNITVQPRLGRAVLWPSVLDEDPGHIDNRTEHEALPVLEGVKYGINAWIHQRDFKSPNRRGCM
jgi:prolyl 4-hydroxylase